MSIKNYEMDGSCTLQILRTRYCGENNINNQTIVYCGENNINNQTIVYCAENNINNQTIVYCAENNINNQTIVSGHAGYTTNVSSAWYQRVQSFSTQYAHIPNAYLMKLL
jgi:hypothetical protein